MQMRCLLIAAALTAATADFVHLVQDENKVWWFEHMGQKFLSFAANHVNNGGPDDGVGGRERAVCQAATNNSLCGDSLNFAGLLNYAPYWNVTQAKYGGNESLWAESAISKISSWGFNGISGWSARVAEAAAVAQGVYYLHLLDIGVTWPYAWDKGLDWDVWSDNYSQQCEHIASVEVAMRANDPYLVAWQTDNEINWGAVGLSTYLKTYGDGPGGAECLSWLQQKYSTIAGLNAAWNITASSWADVKNHLQDKGINLAAFSADDGAWQAVVAEQYFAVATAAIRKYDQNHMISGVRFAVNSAAITAVAGKYCDFLDQHDYSDLPNIDWLAQMYNITGKPLVLGEFSFTAADSNLPNTHGARAGNPEVTQTARARKYAAYAQTLVVQPFVLGYGWWNFVDEPATGRWPDGENSNYGLFTLADDPYSILTGTMTALHAAAPQWHAQGYVPCPPPGPDTPLVELGIWYSSIRTDTFVTTSDCYECYDLYTYMGSGGYVYGECVQGSIPLQTYYNSYQSDNALLTPAAGAPPQANYTYVRVEGWALPLNATGTPGTQVLYSTLLTNPKLDYRAAAGAAGLANATAQGYASLGPMAVVFTAPTPRV